MRSQSHFRAAGGAGDWEDGQPEAWEDAAAGPSPASAAGGTLSGWAAHMQSLDMAVRCEICKEIYENAVSLPCQHMFCSSCIRRYLKDHGAHCPKCNETAETQEIRPASTIQAIVAAFRAARPDLLQLARRESLGRRNGHGGGGTDAAGPNLHDGAARGEGGGSGNRDRCSSDVVLVSDRDASESGGVSGCNSESGDDDDDSDYLGEKGPRPAAAARRKQDRGKSRGRNSPAPSSQRRREMNGLGGKRKRQVSTGSGGGSDGGGAGGGAGRGGRAHRGGKTGNVCPICTSTIFGDIAVFEMHVNECLNKQEQRPVCPTSSKGKTAVCQVDDRDADRTLQSAYATTADRSAKCEREDQPRSAVAKKPDKIPKLVRSRIRSTGHAPARTRWLSTFQFYCVRSGRHFSPSP